MPQSEDTKTKAYFSSSERHPYFFNKIGFRLFLLFALPVLTCMATLYIASVHTRSMVRSHENFKNIQSEVQSAAHSLALNIHEAESLVSHFIVTKETTHQERFQKIWENIGGDARALIETIDHLGPSHGEQLHKCSNDVRRNLQEFVTASGEIFAKPSAATSLERLAQVSNLRRNINSDLQRFMAEALVSEQEVFKNSNNHSLENYNSHLKLVALALVLCLFITVFISKNIVSRIKQISDRCQDIAQGEGDLTKRFNLTSSDELGVMSRYFDLFLDKTFHLVESTAAAVDQVDASMHVVHGLTCQSVEATKVLHKNSALEQLSMDKCQIAVSSLEEGMKVANERVKRTVELAIEGQNQAHQGASRISEAFSAINQVLEHTKNVTNHVDAIAHIADQTKVLSINASIEACKAGMAGDGFAFVAEEIRGLSETVQRLSSELRIFLEATSKEVALGSQLAQSSSETLQLMISTVNTVANQVQDMEKTTNEHSEHVALVAEQVCMLMNTINSNASSAEQVNQSSQKLLIESSNLQKLTENLNQLSNQFGSDDEVQQSAA